jgi:predicted enzyme related to lactoylglutathione lyase
VRTRCKALDDAGHAYEIKRVKGGRLRPWTWRSFTSDRAEVERLSGQRAVPILVLDNGEVIAESGRNRQLGAVEMRPSARPAQHRAVGPARPCAQWQNRCVPSPAVTAFRPGDVSYLRIPAKDPAAAGAFYEAVFGWHRREDDITSFADASGHVIGHFLPDHEVAGESGVRPYIYVASVEDTVARLTARGGTIATAPYREGDLIVATFRDPMGNVIGVWQRSGRG